MLSIAYSADAAGWPVTPANPVAGNRGNHPPEGRSPESRAPHFRSEAQFHIGSTFDTSVGRTR